MLIATHQLGVRNNCIRIYVTRAPQGWASYARLSPKKGHNFVKNRSMGLIIKLDHGIIVRNIIPESDKEYCTIIEIRGRKPSIIRKFGISRAITLRRINQCDCL